MPARPGPAAGASFSADTLVATPSGEQTIGSLKAGDLVVEAYDPATGQTEAEPVQHVWVNHDHDLVDVRVQRGTGSGTAKSQASAGSNSQHHASKGGGRRLRATLVAGLLGLAVVGGATLAQAAVPASPATPTAPETVHTTANHPWLTADHGWVPAGLLKPGELLVTLSGATGTVAQVRATPGAAAMYNLTVANDHTYAVGAGLWVVHNTGGPIFASPDLPLPPYFRGTTMGWPGSRGAQILGISPVSTDPLVATMFATEAETRYGVPGVVHVFQAGDLDGVRVVEGNVRAALEAEVGVELSPLDLAARASATISAGDARGILNDLGYNLPSRVSADQSTELLNTTPRLSPEETNQFVNKAKGGGC